MHSHDSLWLYIGLIANLQNVDKHKKQTMMKLIIQNFFTKFIFRLFPLICIFIQRSGNAQTNIAAGNVSGTWNISGSPYLIQGHIFIPSGSTLTIDPGVKVLFQGHYKLNIQGRILAIGNNIDSIYFGVPNSLIWPGWWGLRFELTTAVQDSSILDYCIIKNGKANASNEDGNGGGIFLKNFSKVRISNCLIADNTTTTGSTLYGNGAGIYCKSSSPIIKNNHITNNSAQFGGGGIFCDDASPLIKNNLIDQNTSQSGGGVYCTASSSFISENTIVNNTVTYGGGGLFCYGSSNNITIFNNIISDNTCIGGIGGGIQCNSSPALIENNIINNNNCNASNGRGGGVACVSSTAMIKNNTINNNYATYSGGGIVSEWSDNSDIINNIITNNSAGVIGGGGISIYTNGNINNNFICNNSSIKGGGILCATAAPKIINNVICNNNASQNGAGVYLDNSSPNITNCSISNNKVTATAGATFGGGGLNCSNISNPIMVNTILYGNEALSGNGNQVYLDDNGSDPSFKHCNIQGGSSAFYTNGSVYSGLYVNNINNNPNYVSPSSGTGNSFNGLTANWELQINSPCINVGTPSISGLNLPTTDIAGVNRVIGTAIDIGAYEYNSCGQILIDTSINQNGTTLISNQLNANYQWIDCNNSLSPISSAINQSFTAIANGSYAVIVNELGCSDTSSCVDITTADIYENHSNNSTLIYPNPTSNQLSIVTELEHSEITIIDITGKLIMAIKQKTNIINTSELSDGIYFINLISEERIITKKFVKQYK